MQETTVATGTASTSGEPPLLRQPVHILGVAMPLPQMRTTDEHHRVRIVDDVDDGEILCEFARDERGVAESRLVARGAALTSQDGAAAGLKLVEIDVAKVRA